MYSRNHCIARGEGRRRGRRGNRYELPLNHVANPRDYLTSRWGAPSFCWVAGDGNTPTVGPALAATGAPGTIAGPWELADGTRLPLETYTGAECRIAAGDTSLDPGAAEDVVIAALIETARDYTTINGILGSFTGSPRGFLLCQWMATGAITLYYDADAIVAPTTPTAPAGSLCLVIFVVNRDGNIVGYLNGAAGTGVACPAGSLVGVGTSLAAATDGAYKNKGKIFWGAAWKGAGLAESWDAARRSELQALATGIEPRGNQAASKGRPTATRASAASWQDDDGRWWIASSGLMRAGDPGGWRRAATRTNEVYNNVNPSVTTGWAVTGGGTTPATLTAVDDSAALATGLMECWGPNVFKLDNSLGDAAAYAYGGAATGNANARSYQVIARQTGAGGAQLGSRDASAGTFTSHVAIAAGGAHARVTAVNKTPADTDEQYAIHAPAGTVVYFVAAQRETGTTCSTPIPNWATAATAARGAEAITPPLTPRNDRGRVSCGVRLMGGASQESIISRAGSWDGVMYGHGSGNWATYDGTTLTTGAARIEGTRQSLAVRWGGATQEITVDGVSASGAYDGARGGSGTYIINAIDSGGGEAAIDSLVIEEAA